jgi:hypothetical protein
MPEYTFRTQGQVIPGMNPGPPSTRLTDWSYDTSSETSQNVSIIASGHGRLYFVNSGGTRFYVPYDYLGGTIGASTIEVNVARSLTSDYSTGLGPVAASDWGDVNGFGPDIFPCTGLLCQFAVAVVTGGAVGCAVFGLQAYWYVRFLCQIGETALPDVGVTMSVPTFHAAVML